MVAGRAGAVAGRVAVDGNLVVFVGAPAVFVGELERAVDTVVLVVVVSLLPQPLTSAPPASATTSHVDSLPKMISPC